MLVSEVKQVFQSKHIQLQNDFLEQVFQWVQETYPHASDEEVIINIFKEWLYLDWCDAPMSILPPNINDTTNTTMNNIFYLQLLNVVDISKPKYLQLKSIRSRFDDHTEDVESCGMLKLQLTDGIQQIAAVEYKKVPCLNLNLPPGMKVKFVPPIDIRSGLIMLKPGMIELIGGGVPEIEVANCVENILAAALKQPLNDNPKNKLVIAPIPQVTDSQRTSVTINSTNNTVINADSQPVVPSSLNIPDEFDAICDDAFFDKHFEANNIRNSPPHSSNAPVQDLTDLEDEILAQREQEEMEASTSTSPVRVNKPSTTKKKNISLDAIFSPVSRPVMTIEKLNKIKDKVTKGIFKIKMEILEVKRKFQVENMEYSMQVLATDETAEIEVMLGHKVLLDIVKVTPDVLHDLWNSGEQSDQVKLQSIMNNLTGAMNDFYAHVTLVIEANSVPVVTEVLETFQLPGN